MSLQNNHITHTSHMPKSDPPKQPECLSGVVGVDGCAWVARPRPGTFRRAPPPAMVMSHSQVKDEADAAAEEEETIKGGETEVVPAMLRR